jgi:hypothetical protein
MNARALVTALLLGILLACAPTMSVPAEYTERPISAEAGADYFLHTGGGDPYATGMAYPVFLALMASYPEELGRDWNEFADKFGLIPDPAAKGDPKAPPIGFHLTNDPNTGVAWVVANCQLCHADRIHLATGDQIVAGMGNKRVRPLAYMAALTRIGLSPSLDADKIEQVADQRAKAWSLKWKYPSILVQASLKGLRQYAQLNAPLVQKTGAALPGRMGTIEAFAHVVGIHAKHPVQMPAAVGWAKVPDIRSFPFRDTFSYDASGVGSPHALVLEADFLFGTRPEWYLKQPHIATSMYMYLRSFTRTLPYPASVDTKLAQRGNAIFERQCAHCHGYYIDHGDEKRVSYKERVVKLADIGTDPARVNAVSPDFVKTSNEYPLTRGYTRVENTGGYVPPVLLDIWARGLYGHAGQWPSLEALATPPEQRPTRFLVDTNGLYDLTRVGVRYEVGARAPRAGEYVYDGATPGLGVQGHPFLSSLASDDRAAVIEYLKTL